MRGIILLIALLVSFLATASQVVEMREVKACADSISQQDYDGAYVAIPGGCHYLDHEVEIIRRNPFPIEPKLVHTTHADMVHRFRDGTPFSVQVFVAAFNWGSNTVAEVDVRLTVRMECSQQ